jgi:hypothetical protein
MRRWPFLLAALGMAAAGLLALRPVLLRKELVLLSVLDRDDGSGRSGQVRRGVERALKDRQGRAGRFRVRHQEIDVFSSGMDVELALSAPSDWEEPRAGSGIHPDRVILPGLLQVALPEVEGDEAGVFRITPARVEEGARGARWAASRGFRRAVVLGMGRRTSERTLLHWAPSRDFMDAAGECGIALAAQEAVEQITEVEAAAARMPLDRVDVVYLSLGDGGALLGIERLRRRGYTGAILLPSWTAGPELLPALARRNAPSVELYSTAGRIVFPGTAQADFYARWGCESARATLDLIERGAPSGVSEWSDALARLRRGTPAEPPLAVWAARDGRWEFLEEIETP